MAQTVQRAIEILELVSERPRTLAEVARQIGVHRSTALRLLQTLTKGGLTRRGSDGRYGVGYRLVGLAQRAAHQFDLRVVAHDHLVALSERTGHTVHLAALQDRDIIYVDKVEPLTAVRLYSEIGKPVRLHTAAVSKAILANIPEDVALQLIGNCDFQRFTDSTIVSWDALRRELDLARQRGWTVDDGELESFVNCVAATVHRGTNDIVGAVSITALKAQANLTDLERLVPDLLQTTQNISRELGWIP